MWKMRARAVFNGGLLIVGLGLTLVSAGPAAAQDDVFAVAGVGVDATAGTAAEAREAAIAQGHVRAMRKLMERLVLQQDLSRVPILRSGQVVEMVRDFSVAEERSSDVRYLADLSFRFNPIEVRSFLRRNRIRFAETRSKPVLVLPLYSDGGEIGLWQELNPWLQSWIARPPDDGLVPLVAPLGDLDDIATITAEQALNADVISLDEIARRYGAEDVLITQAELESGAPSGELPLRVTIRRARQIQLEPAVVNSFRQQTGEDLEAALRRAMARVVEEVQESWKRSNQLSYEQQRSVLALALYGSFADWIEIQRRLSAAASVASSRIDYLTRSFAVLDLRVVGSDEQITSILAQRDITLTTDGSAGWRLRLTRSSGGLGASAPAAVGPPGQLMGPETNALPAAATAPTGAEVEAVPVDNPPVAE
jgi:hypothetical protein